MKNIGEICNLSDLVTGQVGKVLSLKETDKKIKRHLLDMGLTRGVKVIIKRKAPTGDPIEITLRDYNLCLSKRELEKIEVQVILK